MAQLSLLLIYVNNYSPFLFFLSFGPQPLSWIFYSQNGICKCNGYGKNYIHLHHICNNKISNSNSNTNIRLLTS